MGIAIDWGNTNTVVMVQEGSRVRPLFPDTNALIPSYLQYDPAGQPQEIGWPAKNALRTGNSYVVMGIKRLLGRACDVMLAAHIQKVYGMNIRTGRQKEIELQVGPELWLPVHQIAHDFFAKLKDLIQQHVPNEKWTDWVATHPVQYSNTQMNTFFGLLEERIFGGTGNFLPESQAVCHLFPPTQNGYTLVIDWGGGTLDLAIVSPQGQCQRLEGVEYGCGGSDMDFRILEALEQSNRIPRLYGLDRTVVREWIEDRKERVLQTSESIPADQVRLPLQTEILSLDFQQDEVLQWIHPLLDRAVNAIRTSYWPHRLQLRHCVLVGGPLQSPVIVERIQKALPGGCQVLGLPPSVSPTIAVAAGAARRLQDPGEPNAILVYDYGVAIDLFDHLLGTLLLQRGQRCPVQSPKAILRPRGGQGAWVDVVVFVRKADVSEHTYHYETSERFRILPQFCDGEAELEVQLIADVRGIVSLRVLDVQASLPIQLPQVGQQLTHPLVSPPYRSYEELPGALLNHWWTKWLVNLLLQGRLPPMHNPQQIEEFLRSELEPSNPQDLFQKAQALFQSISSWTQQKLPTLFPTLSTISVPNAVNVSNWKDVLHDFGDQLLRFLAQATRALGQQRILPPLEVWLAQQNPSPHQIQFSCQRLQQILASFTGTETEYQHLLAVAAELKAKLHTVQVSPQLLECFSLLDQIVHFRYHVYSLLP